MFPPTTREKTAFFVHTAVDGDTIIEIESVRLADMKSLLTSTRPLTATQLSSTVSSFAALLLSESITFEQKTEITRLLSFKESTFEDATVAGTCKAGLQFICRFLRLKIKNRISKNAIEVEKVKRRFVARVVLAVAVMAVSFSVVLSGVKAGGK